MSWFWNYYSLVEESKASLANDSFQAGTWKTKNEPGTFSPETKEVLKKTMSMRQKDTSANMKISQMPNLG